MSESPAAAPRGVLSLVSSGEVHVFGVTLVWVTPGADLSPALASALQQVILSLAAYS